MTGAMALTWPVVAAVLFGAMLHAGWNVLVKSSTDKALDTALIHLLGSLIAIPLVALVGWPPASAWPWLAASLVIHVAYYTALAGAYQHGDLGLTYPLMRGTAPLLVALSATLTLGETLAPLAWIGVLAVSAGVLTLGLSKHAFEAPKAVRFALVNAVIIAIYTVVDALGVRASGQALQYVATLFLLDGWPFALIVFFRRRGGGGVLPYARKRWPLALVGAAASLGSYGIALWAMTQAPVATVAALRETSVLFAVLLGVWLLKEVFTPRRVIGICTIVAGVMALRLG
jgi:phosphonate utilization associated putative membrane protein